MTTENLMNLTLTHGSHTSREEGMCLMEAVAFLGGEAHSDHPACACPILAAYARTLNDKMGYGAESDALRAKYLAPLAKKLVGTRSTPEVERKRMYYFADRAVRLFAPKALEVAGFTKEADALRALPEIVDERTARAARAADAAADADAAHGAARASRAAARAAARASRAAARAAWAAARAAWAADAAAAYAARAAAAADAAVNAAAWAADAAWSAAGAAWAADAAWEQAAEVLVKACEITESKEGE
jgi:hypothetical protein